MSIFASHALLHFFVALLLLLMLFRVLIGIPDLVMSVSEQAFLMAGCLICGKKNERAELIHLRDQVNMHGMTSFYANYVTKIDFLIDAETFYRKF